MTTLSCVVELVAGIKSFHKRFMITVHHNVRIALKVMTKVFDNKVQSKKVSGKRGVLALCRIKVLEKNAFGRNVLSMGCMMEAPQPIFEASETSTVSASDRGCARVA